MDSVALRQETRREADEQERNDDQNLDVAGHAIELRSQHQRVHRRECDGDEDSQAQVHARVQEVLVEIAAPELPFELAIECEPGKSRAQLTRVRGIWQIFGK